MSSSFVSDGSGPVGPDLWNQEPLAPKTPPSEAVGEEIVWSRPETLRSAPEPNEPPHPHAGKETLRHTRPASRTAPKGRPVKKAARKSTKRAKSSGTRSGRKRS
jgi:hypothetical protein